MSKNELGRVEVLARVKTDAGRELLPAVDAVLGGMQFFSSSVKGHQFTDTSADKAAHRHEVQFRRSTSNGPFSF